LFLKAAAVAVKLKEIWKEQAKRRQLASQNNNAGRAVYLNSDKQADPVHCNVKASHYSSPGFIHKTMTRKSRKWDGEAKAARRRQSVPHV
jgi:hypothetical protein